MVSVVKIDVGSEPEYALLQMAMDHFAETLESGLADFKCPDHPDKDHVVQIREEDGKFIVEVTGYCCPTCKELLEARVSR